MWTAKRFFVGIHRHTLEPHAFRPWLGKRAYNPGTDLSDLRQIDKIQRVASQRIIDIGVKIGLLALWIINIIGARAADQPGAIPKPGSGSGATQILPTVTSQLVSPPPGEKSAGSREGITGSPDLLRSLPVTNGLIRWWPNVFDTREMMTGQDGIVMGIFTNAATGQPDPTEFDWQSGWVQLQPAITNEEFTVAFWIVTRPNWTVANAIVLGQESATNAWFFSSDNGGVDFSVVTERRDRADRAEHIRLSPQKWHHVGIAQRANGTCTVWVDGERTLDGTRIHAWPADGRWFTVGNSLRGKNPFGGCLRDLCVFNRLLDGEEMRKLHSNGLPSRPAANPPARIAAQLRPHATLSSSNVVAGLSRGWIHRSLTTEDGLPGNIVQTILEARSGHLWVGMEEGLSRYDGWRLRSFTPENTSAMRAIGRDVLSLAEDMDGTIWAGVYGGLLSIRGNQVKAFTNGLSERLIHSVMPAGDGSVWVFGFRLDGPRGSGVLRQYHPETGRSSAELTLPGHIREMVAVTNGLWISTTEPTQVLFWDKRSATASVMGRISGWPDPVRLAQHPLLAKASVRTWESEVGATNRWAELIVEPGGPAFRWHWNSVPPWERANEWWTSPHSGDWTGAGRSLNRQGEKVLEVFTDDAVSPANPKISCLHFSREDVVCYGSLEDGLHLLQEGSVRVLTTKEGLSGNEIRSVKTAKDGSLWVATGNGLSRLAEGRWTTLYRTAVNTLTTLTNGQTWFGASDGGPFALHPIGTNGQAETLVVDFNWADPISLRFAPDGALWVVSRRNLVRLDLDQYVRAPGMRLIPKPSRESPPYLRHITGTELPDKNLGGLIVDLDGSVWVGTQGAGLIHATPHSSGPSRIEIFTTQDGLPGDICAPVHRDDSGALWITSDGGITRRKAGKFQSIRQTDGLPNDLLLDMIEDDLGNFWFTGKKGIHRIARREVEAFLDGRVRQIRTLTLGIRDGLLTPECSSLFYPTMAKTVDGHIWVATRNGLATFDPQRVQFNSRPVSVMIERLTLNRMEFPLPESAAIEVPPSVNVENGSPAQLPIHLPPGSGRSVEIEFAAITLAGSGRVRFRHRLDGYDQDWSPVTDLRRAFYTNLRPGDYRFRVQAANSHGIWNETETVLPFFIRPYVWQTTTFYIVLAATIVAAVGGLHWRRVLALKRLDELKHQQALASERSRIAADMHDELGAALTQIAILGEVTKSQLSDSEKARVSLSRITQSARDVAASISDLVWSTNPRHETLDNFAAYLREHAARQFENTSIRAQLDFPATFPDVRLSATFRRNVLLVTKEAINNIVKHSGATVASVQLELEGSSLDLRIADNGRGFSKLSLTTRGNGLVNMRRRIVDDLGGTFDLSANAGSGTTIQIRVTPARTQ